MELSGPYIGKVVTNKDPAKLGRIKANVPHAYGISDETFSPIGITDLPWAIPAGLPAGGAASSGGIDWLPDPGDQVLIFFINGEPEKPVWMWMMQTLDQAAGFPLHKYSKASAEGVPIRAGLTRYGHTFEINSGSILASTSHGYQLYLLDGTPAFDGSITLQTPRAQSFDIDDLTGTGTLNINVDCYFNVGATWQAMCDDLDFESITGDFKFLIGNDWKAEVTHNLDFVVLGDETHATTGQRTDDVTGAWTMSATDTLSLVATGLLNMEFAELNLGLAATEPYVLGNRLMTMLNTLLIWLAGHTHSNGNNGSPTGPPITPPQPEMQTLLDNILSATIKGQP
jgi:hypothetical protein